MQSSVRVYGAVSNVYVLHETDVWCICVAVSSAVHAGCCVMGSPQSLILHGRV